MSSDPPNSQLKEQTPLRPVRLGPASVDIERRADGAMVLRSPRALEAYPEKLTERLAHWANAAPERIFLSQRDGAAGWRSLSYREAYASVRAIAAALLERPLSPERPIAILSGNDIEHALLGLAAMHVGIPYAPISVPYSLVSRDFKKLKAIIEILTPGLALRRRRDGIRTRDGGNGAGGRRDRRHRQPGRRPANDAVHRAAARARERDR